MFYPHRAPPPLTQQPTRSTAHPASTAATPHFHPEGGRQNPRRRATPLQRSLLTGGELCLSLCVCDLFLFEQTVHKLVGEGDAVGVLLELALCVTWPLHDIIITNLVWCMAYLREVEGGSFTAT